MDTEYIIDCAVQLGEVSPLEAAMLAANPKTYQTIRHAVDNDSAAGADFIANTSRTGLQELTHAQIAIAGLVATESLPHVLKFNVERLENLVYVQARKDLFDGQEPPSYLSLLDGQQSVEHFFGPLNELSEESVHAFLDRVALGVRSKLATDLMVMKAVEASLEAPGSQLREKLPTLARSLVDAHLNLGYLKQLAKARKANKAAANKVDLQIEDVLIKATPRINVAAQIAERAKKSIKKAYKLFQNHHKEELLMKFMAGEEVELSHSSSALKFIIRAPKGAKGWLMSKTVATNGAFTPYDMRLFTKDNVFLARLCVYFKETPVLDHLLSMSFFVESGAEERILEAANFYGIEMSTLKTHADKSPAIAQKIVSYEAEIASRKAQGHSSCYSLSHAISQTRALRAINWWESAYKPQVAQWVRSWVETGAAGIYSLAARSDDVVNSLTKWFPKGVSVDMLFKVAIGHQLGISEVRHLCKEQNTATSRSLLNYLDRQERAARERVIASARDIDNAPQLKLPHTLSLNSVAALL